MGSSLQPVKRQEDVDDASVAISTGVRSLAQLTKLVEGAILSILGKSIATDQPLVEAGLDSLGKPAYKDHGQVYYILGDH